MIIHGVNGADIPVTNQKGLVTHEGKTCFHCTNCWQPGNIYDLQHPVERFVTLVLGIHPQLLYGTNSIYQKYEHSEWHPFIQERMLFCDHCADFAIETIMRILSELHRFPRPFLASKLDLPDLDPKTGHYVTLTEIIPFAWGRFFNVQLSKDGYRRLVCDQLPRNWLHFHIKGGSINWDDLHYRL